VLAFRSGGGAGLGLAFFAVAVLLMPLGIGPETALLGRVAPGLLWVAALLAALLTLDRLFQADHEDGALDVLALSPLPLEAVAAVKALAHWLSSGLPLVIAAPVLGIALGLPAAAMGPLVLGLAIGTPALSFIGAAGAALSVGVRRGGLLLSLIVLPLYVPTLIFGARAADLAAQGLDPGTALALEGAVSLLALAAGPFAAAAALRVNLR
jgi:heme exporter protein B